MKYIISITLVFFALFQVGFASALVSTEELKEAVVESTEKTTEENMKTVESVAAPQKIEALKLTVAELKAASYTYYYSDTCPHCINMNTFLKKYDAYNILDIDKKEVSKSEANQKDYFADAKRVLGDRQVGTPFMIVKSGENEIPLIGTDNIKAFIQPALGTEVSETYKQEKIAEKNNKMITLGLLLLVALGIPGGLYLIGRKK